MFLSGKALKIRNKFVRILATILNRIGNTTYGLRVLCTSPQSVCIVFRKQKLNNSHNLMFRSNIQVLVQFN